MTRLPTRAASRPLVFSVGFHLEIKPDSVARIVESRFLQQHFARRCLGVKIVRPRGS
jgi:hypothetical protein